ncbi:MarR family transcriptional regulator [Modestobacter sp. I12A-02628]|uniref:Winged helix-turn-helix transcriptional regulator n=2 Tax=Goekera deserti TaxID=2497753 RepID=A0A7K3WKG6_9ACTN|nr:MarR family transcriptional regulator [Goekera deserti]NDI48422.1 MarR family transcriptional regulator [Goekera deserti]NEL56023.1 winged helix-turn-helix transcriptional regulator [Goekera deserti]
MRAARTLRRRSSELLEPWDLSPHQARALGVVCRHDAPRLAELAERLRIAPRSATEVVDALQARGLVERVPDEADRRAVLIRPTAAGRAVREQVDAAREADSETVFARLDPTDRATLARILRSLTED